MTLNQFDKKHWYFPREHTGKAPDRTAPVTGWGVELLRVLGIVMVLVVIFEIAKAVW